MAVYPSTGRPGGARARFRGWWRSSGGVSHTLPPASSSVYRTHPHAFVCPYFHQGAAIGEVTLTLIAKGAVELAPLPSLGFSSCRFLVWKSLGSWRPVIDLSLLSHFVDISHFRLVPIQSVLMSVRQGEWTASIDLREVYPQFLCTRNLVASCALWLMAALTDSMSCTSVCPRPRRSSLGLWLLYPFFIPWVSVCVVTGMTGSSRHRPRRPSSGILGLSCPFVTSWGLWSTRSSPTSLCLRWYIISGWSSPHRLLWLLHRQISSPGCGHPLTDSVLRSASCLLVAVTSGVAVLSLTSGSRGPPADEFAPDLPSPLLGSVGSFSSGAMVSGLSSGPSVVASRGSLLSRCLFPAGVPSSCLLVRHFRRRLGASLGCQGCFRPVGPVGGSSSCQCQGVAGCASRSPPLPVLSVWDHGGHVLRHVTAVPYLLKVGGGDLSPALDTVAQGILRWAESLRIRLAPQFLPGIRNFLTASLSRPHQLPSSAWSLHFDVFRSLRRRWPVMFDLCATSDHHRCYIFFSPYQDPLSAGTDALLQFWDGLLACAFPSWSVLPWVLAKLRMSHWTLLTLIA